MFVRLFCVVALLLLTVFSIGLTVPRALNGFPSMFVFAALGTNSALCLVAVLLGALPLNSKSGLLKRLQKRHEERNRRGVSGELASMLLFVVFGMPWVVLTAAIVNRGEISAAVLILPWLLSLIGALAIGRGLVS